MQAADPVGHVICPIDVQLARVLVPVVDHHQQISVVLRLRVRGVRGGLVLGGHAWYWAYSNTDASHNYPGNKIAPTTTTKFQLLLYDLVVGPTTYLVNGCCIN